MKNLFCVALLYVSFFAQAQRLDLLPAAQTPIGLVGKYGIQFYETYPGSGVFQASAEKVKYTDLFAPLIYKVDSGALYTSRYAWQRYKDSMATVLANLKLVPSVTGHAGKYLVTDGSTSFWSPMGGLISSFFNDANYVKRDSGDVRYAVANHNHAGVYQPAGTYLTAEADPKRVVSIAITGTGTKTVTATLADGSTVSNTFTDLQGGSGGAQTDTTVLSTRLTDVVVAANNLQVAKVDKITGKGLSANDYTDAEKTKLAGIAAGATVNRSDAATDALLLNKVDKAAFKDSVLHVIQDSFAIVTPSWLAVTANHNLTKSNPRITVNPATAGITITLPSLTAGAGTDFYVDITDSTNAVTLIGNIEGSTNKVIKAKKMIVLSADLTLWRLLDPGAAVAGGGSGNVTAASIGLGNVDNTSDAAKPISTATQTALNGKAPLASPVFSGTAKIGTDTVATQAYARSVGGSGGGSGGGTDLSTFPIFTHTSTSTWTHDAGDFYMSKIPFTGTPAIDTHSGWSSTNNYWTVPTGQSGIYRISFSLQMPDNAHDGIGWGIGWSKTDETGTVNGVANGQNINVLDVTSSAYKSFDTRQTLQGSRVANLTAGDHVQLNGYMVYGDGNLAMKNAYLLIERIR